MLNRLFFFGVFFDQLSRILCYVIFFWWFPWSNVHHVELEYPLCLQPSDQLLRILDQHGQFGFALHFANDFKRHSSAAVLEMSNCLSSSATQSAFVLGVVFWSYVCGADVQFTPFYRFVMIQKDGLLIESTVCCPFFVLGRNEDCFLGLSKVRVRTV